MALRAFSFLLITSTLNASPILANGSTGLLDIYEQALRSDPQISAANFARDAGQEKIEQGLSLLRPQASFSAEINYTKTEADYVGGDSQADSSSVALQLTQPLYNASRFTSYKQSKLITKQSDLQYFVAEQELILRVAQAYFDVLSAEENFAVTQAQTRAFEESLARAKLTFKVGTATKTDKLEAQARYDLGRASELSAENSVAIAKQILSSITGNEVRKLHTLNNKVRLTPINPVQMDGWVELATANSYSLQLSQTGLDIAKNELTKLKDDRWPTIDFVASAGGRKQFSAFVRNNDGSFGRDITTVNLSAGITLSLPLYTGGLMSSRIREAEHLRAQQKELRLNNHRQVVLQTQQAYLMAMNGFQQVTALKQASLSSESALKATKKGLEVGVRTNLDVLDAQQQYYSTERDLSVAKFNYLLQVLALKAAAGVLSTDDIQSLDTLLTNG